MLAVEAAALVVWAQGADIVSVVGVAVVEGRHGVATWECSGHATYSGKLQTQILQDG